MKRAAALAGVCAVLTASVVLAQTPPPPAPAVVQAEAPPPESAPITAPAAAPTAPVVMPPRAPAAPPTPLKRPRGDQAVVQVLDKITARSVRLTLDVGKTAVYETLVFTVRACETNAPDEPRPEAAAYLQIDSQPISQGRRATAKTVFKGWMYASSPSLSPFEHSVYDVWMVGCKSKNPPPAPPPPPAPAPKPKPVTPAPPPAPAATPAQ